MNQQQLRLVQIIQKVPIFGGLQSDEVGKVLQVCKSRKFEPNEEVYRAGAPSDDMLILLRGQFMVLGRGGEPVGSVTAGHSMGEMGVFTGQGRSATVVAATECATMTIRKIDLEMVMMRNAGTYVKVLKNVVCILATRLGEANTANEQHMKTIMRMREMVEGRGASE